MLAMIHPSYVLGCQQGKHSSEFRNAHFVATENGHDFGRDQNQEVLWSYLRGLNIVFAIVVICILYYVETSENVVTHFNLWSHAFHEKQNLK